VIRRLMREHGLQSKRRFAIEGEHPPQDRIQRWGRAIGEAGRRPIGLDELLRLRSDTSPCGQYARGWAFRCVGDCLMEPDRQTAIDKLRLAGHLLAEAGVVIDAYCVDMSVDCRRLTIDLLITRTTPSEADDLIRALLWPEKIN
jgi:hypothetical protein